MTDPESMADLLAPYVAMDRRHALTSGIALPDRSSGAVLLADIAGFTPLTAALADALGPRRGAEELTRLLNRVYTALVSRVHHFGGSVVCFIGDALVSYYDGDAGLRAVASALQMQRQMKEFQMMRAPHGGRVSLAMKAAIAAGPVRRFLIGDADAQLLDVLAGTTVDRLSDAEHAAERGEVIVSPEVASAVGSELVIDGWRGPFGVVGGIRGSIEPVPWDDASPAVAVEQLEAFVLPAVHDRIASGQGEYLAELRPVVAIFLEFEGLTYDEDDSVGNRLDAFATWVQHVVVRYGGHVFLLTTADKGSHLYAVFGAPEAHEDDADRAVAAAIRLLEPPADLDFITGIRIGVSQGRARVGAYGADARRTYGALGDAVNMAARLMGIAPFGEIRCNAQVRANAGGRWAFEVLPAVALKGIREPQPVFRPIERRREASKRSTTRLIGREREVQRLLALFDALGDGRRRTLLFEGEAGIGKSRLVEEVRDRAVARGLAVLAGAADSIERQTPYRAWRDVVAALLEIDDAASADDGRRSAIEAVSALDATFTDRAPLLNDILGLDLPETRLTANYDPELRKESLAALVGGLVRRRASMGAVVLVLEDLHWFDSSSWDLLVSVARTVGDRPVLLLLTHRPFGDPVPQAVGVVRGMPGTETVSLESLPPEDAVALAASRVGVPVDGLPEAVADLVIERAEGNPFFAVELIASLLDNKRITVERNACSVNGSLEDLRESLPDTLEGVVLSRLDRLGEDERLSLKVASVVGRSFLVRTVCDVDPRDIAATKVRAHFDDTTKRRLTQLEAPEPVWAFAFQHVVTQQVAYDTLLFEQRRTLHRNVADWVERTHAGNLNPHAPLLALHWQRAGSAERELHYRCIAGTQAAAQHANAEAEAQLTRAIALIDTEGAPGSEAKRFDVLRTRAGVRAVLGNVEGEQADLETLTALAEAEDRPTMEAEVLLLWSDFHKRCGRFENAQQQAERALATMQEAGDEVGEARALSAIGNALEGLGDFAGARDRVTRALDRFRCADDGAGQADTLKSLGIIHARLGELDQGMDRFREAREIFRLIGNRKGEADILGNLGALNYYLGRYEDTIEFTEQAQALFHEIGNRAGSAKCLTNLGNSYTELGSFGEGLESHRRALDVYRQLDDESGCADSLCNIGVARAALGVGGMPGLAACVAGDDAELGRAIDAFRAALDRYTRIGNRRGEMLARFNLGTTELCLGDVSSSEDDLQAALELSRQLGLEGSVTWALAMLARARLASDDAAGAMELSTEAVGRLGDELPPEADEIHFAHHNVLIAHGRDAEALPHLEIAHRLIVERADAIRDETLRDGFLAAYREVLDAMGRHADR